MQMDERRMEFVCAAEELFDEKGIARTSIGDIARRVGVTRSLFYHYFNNKLDVIDAVTDYKAHKLRDYLYEWSMSLDVHDVHAALYQFVGILRERLCGPTSMGSQIIHERDYELFQRFAMRVAEDMARTAISHSGRPGAIVNLTDVRHPEESFYILWLGIMNSLLFDRGLSDEVIADLIVDTMHISC